jgi:hypothetical protein
MFGVIRCRLNMLNGYLDRKYTSSETDINDVETKTPMGYQKERRHHPTSRLS